MLRDRRMLACDGVVMVALTVDGQTGQAVSGPDLIGRGFLSDPDDPVMAAARKHLADALRAARRETTTPPRRAT